MKLNSLTFTTELSKAPTVSSSKCGRMPACSISASATGCVSRSGNHGLIEGILTRYNKRTVTVITDDRRQWNNVSPGFLRRAARPLAQLKPRRRTSLQVEIAKHPP